MQQEVCPQWPENKALADQSDEPRRKRKQEGSARNNDNHREKQVACEGKGSNGESAFEESDHSKDQRDVKEGSQDSGANPHEPCAPQELGRYRVKWEPNEHGLLLGRG